MRGYILTPQYHIEALMAKYGKKAQSKIKKVMKEYGHGKLKSGKSKKTVKNRKQAVAIAISEARQRGYKVPSKKKKNLA